VPLKNGTTHGCTYQQWQDAVDAVVEEEGAPITFEQAVLDKLNTMSLTEGEEG
jgi:hypothetical protein